MLQLSIMRFVVRDKLSKTDVFPEGVSAIISDFLARSHRDALSGHWSVAQLLQTEPHYRQWAFSRALLKAVRRSDLVLIKWLLSHFPTLPIKHYVLEEAAEKGLLWFYQLLEQDSARGLIDWNGVHEGAKQEDDIEQHHWEFFPAVDGRDAEDLTRDVGPQGKVFGLGMFGRTRNLEVLAATDRFLQKRQPLGPGVPPINSSEDYHSLWNIYEDCPFRGLNRAQMSNFKLTRAASGRHWDLVLWLDMRTSTPETRSRNMTLVCQAFEQNKFDELKWLLRQGFRIALVRFPACDAKEWRVRSEMVRYIIEEGLGDSAYVAASALGEAAAHDDLDLVQWLCLHHIPTATDDGNVSYTYESTLKRAAKGGHLAVVQWLLTRTKELGFHHGPSSAMFVTAEGGQLNVVKWLYEQYAEDSGTELFRDQEDSSDGVDLRPFTVVDVAAKEGHLDILQFLHRADLSLRTRRKDRDGGAQPQRSLPLHCTTIAMDAAAGHLEVVKWLHENRSEGCTTKAMDRAAANGHLEVVKWLHENRPEGCTTNAMDDAAGLGQLSLVQWLHDNRTEGCTAHAVDCAAANGHLEVVPWLLANRSEGRAATALAAAAGCSHPSAIWHGNHRRVVQWLLANCDGGKIVAAIGRSLMAMHFEVALFLHFSTQQQTYSETTRRRIRASFGWDEECQRAWFDDNYPPRATSAKEQRSQEENLIS